MNIVNRLTLRHLRLNKKRTLVTIIGVIISAAMICAVSTFAVSFLDLFQRQAIAQTGDWQVRYNRVSAEKVSVIERDRNTKSMTLWRDVGYSLLPESQNEGKPYLFLEETTQEGFETFPFDLIEGRFPQSPDEVVVSAHLSSNGGIPVKVGDTLTLVFGIRTADLGDGMQSLTQEYSYMDAETFTPNGQTRTVTVTGIIERPTMEPYQAPGYMVFSLLDRDSLAPSDLVDVTTSLKDISRELYERSPQIAAAAGVPSYPGANGEPEYDIEFNRELLRYYGITSNELISDTIYSFALIIILIIMVGSIALIYNAFAISISERSRHLGMLASVGATKAQKRRSVFFEGFVIGLISIPLGIGFGILGMWITFQFVSPLLVNIVGDGATLQLVVSPLSIAISILFSALTILISVWIPAHRASRITPIDAIRQTRDIKLKGKAVRTSRLTRRIFGFEAELALKNLKRNKKRYRSTIFSLVISIVLFLATSFYLNIGQDALGLDMQSFDYDLLVSAQSKEDGGVSSFYDQIRELPDVDQAITTNSVLGGLSLKLLKSQIPQEILHLFSSDPDNPNALYATVLSLNDEALRQYAAQCGVDFELLKDAGHPSAILYNNGVIRDEEGRVVETELYEGHVGDTLSIFFDDPSRSSPSFDLQLAGFSKSPPIGASSQFYGNYIFIVSEDVLAAVDSAYSPDNAALYLTSPAPDQLEENISSLQRQQASYISVDINNYASARQYNNSMLLFILIFVYGFIILITLICVANIFNTISTSISLRRREFAMLRSVGMTPKGFGRMIRFESLFYGIKALLYAIPVSFLTLIWMYNTIRGGFLFDLSIPWMQIGIAIAAVFLVVFLTMLYSGSKIKKQDIIDTLKQENI